MQPRRLDNAYVFLKIPSTQDKAWELASAGAPSNTLIIAGMQSSGRGRHGRNWCSPAGGLWFSLLHYPARLSDTANILLLAAKALQKSLETVAGVKTRLKLPNDLYYQDGKLAGIILEQKNDKIVLGIGVNVNFDREVLPEGLAATTLKEILGHRVSRAAILSSFLSNLRKSKALKNF